MSLFDKEIIKNDKDIKLKKLLEDIENSKILFSHKYVNLRRELPPHGKLFYLELDI